MIQYTNKYGADELNAVDIKFVNTAALLDLALLAFPKTSEGDCFISFRPQYLHAPL